MQPLRSAPISRLSSLLRAAPSLGPASVLRALRGPPAWLAPFASGREVPTFREAACLELTPPPCRMPSGPQSGTSQTRPGLTTAPRFRHRPYAFDTSSAVHLRSSSQDLPDGIKSRLSPQRSPPRILSVAACGGLEPAPDRWLRGALPHLLHSMAPPFVSTFVAHSRRRRRRHGHGTHRRSWSDASASGIGSCRYWRAAGSRRPERKR